MRNGFLWMNICRRSTQNLRIESNCFVGDIVMLKETRSALEITKFGCKNIPNTIV